MVQPALRAQLVQQVLLVPPAHRVRKVTLVRRVHRVRKVLQV